MKMRLFAVLFVSLSVCQWVASLEIEEYHHRQKRQLDWNNGADYQFDHVAVSSNRHLRRDSDDGIVADANALDAAAPAGAHPPEGVPGEPGVDYPILPSIPLTNFHCRGRVPGYYGDTETACQVFHVCDVSGRQDSFLCPNGTVFSQKLFSCDWWYNVQCAVTRQHYELNRNLFKGSETNLYGTPSFWNWLSEINDEEPSTQRDGPPRPDEDDDDSDSSGESKEELPVAQPLVSQHAARQQSVQLPPVAQGTPRPVITSTRQPLILGGWVPLASTGPSTTSTPKPAAATVAIRPNEPVARKRSPTTAAPTVRSETRSTSSSGDEWWHTGFMRDYRMPNFGWARENLFPAEQGTTPELAWMDIGPNGPLMTDAIAKHHVAAQSTSAPPAQQDRRRKVKQSGRQLDDDSPPSQVPHLKPVHQAPKPIQQQKVVAKPQVVHQQRPVAQQAASQIQQLPFIPFVAPVDPPTQFVKKQPTQAPKPRTTTTAKPKTTTTTTTGAPFNFFNDDDSPFSNNDGQTHSAQKNQRPIIGKFKKSSNNKKRLATATSAPETKHIAPSTTLQDFTKKAPSAPETKQIAPSTRAQDSTKKAPSVQKTAAKPLNPWLQPPTSGSNSSKQSVQKPRTRTATSTAASASSFPATTQAPSVKRGKPIHQPDAATARFSRKRDPFAGIVMERVSAPFRPSAPLSAAPVAAASSQSTARSFNGSPNVGARSSGQKKKRSRSPNAYDPRLDRPYRQEHPIWKMLNWESTRM